MARKAILIPVLILVLVLVGGGVVWALNFLGVVDTKPFLRKVPVISKLVPAPKEAAKKPKPKVSPLEEENKKLKENLKEAESKLAESESEKNKLAQANTDLEKAIQELQAWKDQQEVQNLSFDDLAKYYANMKPDKAAAIMAHLDENIVIGILSKMNKEQSGLVLSAMTPERAADLTENMAAL